MKVHIFVFSEKGACIALRVQEHFVGSEIHSIEKFAVPHGFTAHKSICADVKSLFEEAELLVFVGACGIAVRSIAPYVKSKTTDPAVLVLDDAGKFVIPILSGHIGGANRMAVSLAQKLKAIPVITTATDSSGRFSVDAWAVQNGFAISSMKIAKEISAAILEDVVPVMSEKPLPAVLPAGLVAADEGMLGVYIGIRRLSPYRQTLRLVPRCVTLGVGCRKDISEAVIRDAVSAALEAAGIDILSVKGISSIDVKRGETGLLHFCESLKISPCFYSAAALASVQGNFEESAFVKQTVGVGNVCERAAMAEGGTLIFPKFIWNGVTVAASESDWRVCFE